MGSAERNNFGDASINPERVWPDGKSFTPKIR
jgi:hypothetical protein